MPLFQRYIGIDYSGAGDADVPQDGIRVFAADTPTPPREVESSHPRRIRWDRNTLAHWLHDQLQTGQRTIVAIDHAFSFPVTYLDHYGLRSWDEVLEDASRRWPLSMRVSDADAEDEEANWVPDDQYRLTEKWTPSAKSVFFRAVEGTVFFSTRAGLPWIGWLRRQLGRTVHFWPFDGFRPPDRRSVVAEVYPAYFKWRYAERFATSHQQDAHATCRWLRERDRLNYLHSYLSPLLAAKEKAIARREGWILGVA